MKYRDDAQVTETCSSFIVDFALMSVGPKKTTNGECTLNTKIRFFVIKMLFAWAKFAEPFILESWKNHKKFS